MSIVTLGSGSFQTTIDVNNGQQTQTFTQRGDAEYDVSVSGTADTKYSGTYSITTTGDNIPSPDHPVFITNGATYDELVFSFNASPLGGNDIDFVSIFVNGGTSDSGEYRYDPQSGDPTSDTLTFSGQIDSIYLDGTDTSVGDIDISGSYDVTPSATVGTSANSITQN